MLLVLLGVATSSSAWTVTKDGLTFTGTGLLGSGDEAEVYLSDYSVTDVVIPATIDYDGIIGFEKGTKKVVKIANHGFTQSSSHFSSYSDGCTPAQTHYMGGYYNPTLKSVTFEQPSNITEIGEGAFDGCTSLETLTIPNSVTTIGQRAFAMCMGLKSLYFQTNNDGTVNFTTLPYEALFYCTALTSLELPSGITQIADRALMGNFALYSIKLPNTLTTIGAHFLCNASSLQTLTIPASVTYIDGAFLHGCESLSKVYLLGPASVLKAQANDGSNTFGANEDFCKDKVTDCLFYTTSDYIDGYTSDEVWSTVDQPNDDGNDIVAIENTDRDFTGGKWVTAIFPDGVANYKAVFGSETMAATMTSATVDADDEGFYHLTFTLISGDDIPAATPVMFYAGKDATYTMYTSDRVSEDDFKKALTADHTAKVEANDGAVVSMIGRYLETQLNPFDFYYSNSGFYRVPESTKIMLGDFRCYWNVNRDNVKTDVQAMGSKFTGGTTGINAIDNTDAKVSVEIYDLGGRRINADKSALQGGVYIINGKKVLVK